MWSLRSSAVPGRGTYGMASGFGARVQWYRNVRANPASAATSAAADWQVPTAGGLRDCWCPGSA